jgi:hypothetical protein
MDDSLIAKLMSSFSTPPISSGEVNALPIIIYYLASEVDSEEEDYVCWDGDDRYFSLAALFDWGWMDSMREPCVGDVTFEDTPRTIKGRRELLNLECSINYDAKVASTRRGRGKSDVF